MEDDIGSKSRRRPEHDRKASNEFDLGERLRRIRLSRQWTLAELADRAGLARSTISKIENHQMSPTFDVLQRLLSALEVELGALGEPRIAPRPLGRRSITREGAGRVVEIRSYRHELLCSDLIHKGFTPMRTVVRARMSPAPPELIHHKGEEFVYVLDGEVECHTELYEAVRLRAGDCLYFDSATGHALVSTSPQDAVILWITKD